MSPTAEGGPDGRRTGRPDGWPGLAALALVVMAGAWAIVTGCLELWVATRMRHELRHAWWWPPSCRWRRVCCCGCALVPTRWPSRSSWAGTR
ncbi:DUF308 domain-containing protein [Streptomyces sp. Ru71]|uniref:DUF308 domain-containing protein n=1 Tax=Streptomyces sp. Ru71 TaxID=2080746 RepID=UPI0027E4E3F6|nr:DUF308 domain-containing protein [Streptomyces sp. Ru71]